MSDLQCPARLLIARHGDAAYRAPRGTLTNEGGTLTDVGKTQVAAFAATLITENVAAVYSSRIDRAVESAAIVGKALGLTPTPIGGVQEYEVGTYEGRAYRDPDVQALFTAWAGGDLSAGFPGGETGAHIVERYREALQDLADQHRGETVVVISHGGVMSLAIPRLAHNVRDDLAREQFLPNAVAADVRVDADGFRVVSWPGSEDRRTV